MTVDKITALRTMRCWFEEGVMTPQEASLFAEEWEYEQRPYRRVLTVAVTHPGVTLEMLVATGCFTFNAPHPFDPFAYARLDEVLSRLSTSPAYETQVMDLDFRTETKTKELVHDIPKKGCALGTLDFLLAVGETEAAFVQTGHRLVALGTMSQLKHAFNPSHLPIVATLKRDKHSDDLIVCLQPGYGCWQQDDRFLAQSPPSPPS